MTFEARVFESEFDPDLDVISREDTPNPQWMPTCALHGVAVYDLDMYTNSRHRWEVYATVWMLIRKEAWFNPDVQYIIIVTDDRTSQYPIADVFATDPQKG